MGQVQGGLDLMGGMPIPAPGGSGGSGGGTSGTQAVGNNEPLLLWTASADLPNAEVLTATAPLTITQNGGAATIAMPMASATQDGYLSHSNFVTFAAATPAIILLTLAPETVTFALPGRNYTLQADFSAFGEFADIGFQPVLQAPGAPGLIISPDYNLWGLGKAGWTIYVPNGYASSTYAPVTLTATLAGRGWSGTQESNLSALWSGPTLVN